MTAVGKARIFDMQFLVSILAAMLAASITPQNGALRFNGLQEATIPDCSALDFNGQLTAECWIKPDGNFPGQNFRYVLSKNYGSDGWGLLMSREYRVHATGTGETATAVPLNKWTHVAYVCSDKKVKLYLNGKLSDEQVGGNLKNSNLQLCVGCSSFFGEPGHQLTNFSGLIAEVRIWNKPMTQFQIRARMKRKLSGKEKHLIVYLPFDEGQGQQARNKAGKTPPLKIGRVFRPDEYDPTWVKESPID